MKDALDDLGYGGSAVRACAQVHQYVDLIPSTVDQVLGAEKTDRLRESLRTALFVRGLAALSVNELDSLDEAAGTFNLRAGDRLARHYADLAGRALRTMSWLVFSLLLLLTAVVLVLVFIPGWAVAQIATALAAIAGTLSGVRRVVRARVAPSRRN